MGISFPPYRNGFRRRLRMPKHHRNRPCRRDCKLTIATCELRVRSSGNIFVCGENFCTDCFACIFVDRLVAPVFIPFHRVFQTNIFGLSAFGVGSATLLRGTREYLLQALIVDCGVVLACVSSKLATKFKTPTTMSWFGIRSKPKATSEEKFGGENVREEQPVFQVGKSKGAMHTEHKNKLQGPESNLFDQGHASNLGDEQTLRMSPTVGNDLTRPSAYTGGKTTSIQGLKASPV